MVEREHFCRFCIFLLDVGAKVLRETFMDKYVGSGTLEKYLKLHKRALSKCLRKGNLRQEQFDMLYPTSSNVPSIENFDLTLLCLLFRSLDKNSKPFDSVWEHPLQTDESYQADVGRIKQIRNTMYGHVESASMNSTTYNKNISDLKTIYERLVTQLSSGQMSTKHLCDLIQDVLNGPLQKGIETEIKRLLLEIEKLHRNNIMWDLRLNIHHLLVLVLDVGTHTLRCYFEKQYVHSYDLEQFLKSKKTILENLYGSKINQKDKDLLCNTECKSLLEKLDISLLALLLIYLCEITPPRCGWTEFPDADDKSPGADILRLRNAGVSLISRPNSTIAATEFHEQWFIISGVISRLSNQLDQQHQKDIETKMKDVRQAETLSGWNSDELTDKKIFNIVFKYSSMLRQRSSNSDESKDASVTGSSFVPSDTELSDEDEGTINEDIQMPQGDKGKICIIKCYVVLKSELEKDKVMDIAKTLFKKNKQKDILDEMARAERRQCVDHLLKRVLRQNAEGLEFFFELLMMKYPKIAQRIAIIEVTEEDTTKFKQVSESTKLVPSRMQNGLKIDQLDIESFQCHLYDVPEKVDKINDVLLSQFKFSIFDHSQVTRISDPKEKICVLWEKIQSCKFESDSEVQSVLGSKLYKHLKQSTCDGFIDASTSVVTTMILQSTSTQPVSTSTGEMSTTLLPATTSLIMTSALTQASGNSNTQATSTSVAINTTIAENTTSKPTMLTTAESTTTLVPNISSFSATSTIETTKLPPNTRMLQNTSMPATSAATGVNSLATEIENSSSGSTKATQVTLTSPADASATGPKHQRIWHYLQDGIQSSMEYVRQKFRVHKIGFMQSKRGSLVLKFVTLDNFDVELLKTDPVATTLRDMIKTLCPGYQDLLNEPVHVTIFLKTQSNTDNTEIYFHLETNSEMKEKEECSHRNIGSRDKRYIVEEMNPTSLKKWLFKKLQIQKETNIQLVDLVSWKDISRKEKMKILLSAIESLENGYILLENYCEENDTLVYEKVFKKHRQMAVEENTKAEILSLFSSKKGEVLQKLSSTWITFGVNPKDKELKTTGEANQEETTENNKEMPQGDEAKICILKSYAILKLEIERDTVMYIARKLFKEKNSKDVLEEMEKAETRRRCVDHLLKRILLGNAAVLQSFLNLLKVKRLEQITKVLEKNEVTEVDRKKFQQINERTEKMEKVPCRIQIGCKIEETDREFLHRRLHYRPEVVDEINDNLLSQFHISISDHSKISLCLNSDEKMHDLFKLLQSCYFHSESELKVVLGSSLFEEWKQSKDTSPRQGQDNPDNQHSILRMILRIPGDILETLFEECRIHSCSGQPGSILLKFLAGDNFDVELLKPEHVEKKLRELIRIACPEYQVLLKEPMHVTLYFRPQRNTDIAEIYFHLETSLEMKEKEEGYVEKLGKHDIEYMIEEVNLTSLREWMFNKLHLDGETKHQLMDLVSWKDMSRRKKMKLLMSTIESLENGYEFLQNYCEEHNTVVYNNVFKKKRQLTLEEKPKANLFIGSSCEEGGGLQVLYRRWIDFSVDPEDEDLMKTVEANQKEAQNFVGDKDLTMTGEANQEDSKKNTKDEDFENDVGANLEHYQKHGKGQVIYDSYKNRQEKAILNETRKCLKALSKKHEDMKRDIIYLQDRQLENSWQWDSLRRDNQEVVIDGEDINYRSRNGESLLHTASLQGNLHTVQLLQSKCPLLVHQTDCKGRSVCHSAAAGGSVDILKFLVQEGADPLCKDVNGMNLLHYACLEGKKEMAYYLVDNYSFMLYSLGKGGYSVPHCAAYGGSIDIFKRICKLINVSSQADIKSYYEENESQHTNQSDLEAQTETGETLLHMACLSGKLEMTQYLVEKYPDMSNKVSKHKASLVHYAAGGNNVSVLQYLIDQGVDPWCRTDTQQTLLHISCIRGRLKIIQYLLEKYPDMINKLDDCNRTPAHYAAYRGKVYDILPITDQDLDQCCSTATQQTETATQQTLFQTTCTNNQLEIMKHLVRKYPEIISLVDNCKETAAHYAAVSGNISVLQYLIGIGLDPWCRAANKETLLHKSCMNRELETTKYLVETYPDMINIVDSGKETPAHYAAQYSSVAVVQYLIDRGLDPWCKTAAQETLLHKSCIAGQFEMTQYLLEKYPEMVEDVDSCKRTAGHFAAQSSNISVLQYLIDQGLDPWCRTDSQETLLHMSCIAGRLEMTQYLIGKYPEMINEVDKRKETSAHYAVQSNNVSVLQHLIDQGMDPWCRTVTQETLLHVSSITGQLEMVKYLVMKYPDMIKMVNIFTETPGHCAAYCGSISVLQYLIKEGLDPWCKSVHQQTLLHLSCIAGHLDMSKYLAEKYPDMLNEVDSSNATLVQSAAYGGNISLMQFLVGHRLDPWCKSVQQQTLLHQSCIAGQLEMTQYLAEEYPAMMNEVEYRAQTPLHYAASSSNVSLVQYLIDQGLDPWCRTATKETLLHRSCIAGRLEMTQYLFEKYPDMISTVDNCKRTPLYYAAQSSNVSLVQYLIDQGIDRWCRTAKEETLLHRSCIVGRLEMTQYMVEKYPDMINKVDNCKETPLHYDAQSSNVSLSQYLIDQGMDPWCRTVTKETLLHRACIAGQLEMTQYLVNKYPDMINMVDNCKLTPLHYAAQSSNITLVQYLIDKGLDPWCRTATEKTLLHVSCIAGRLEMTQYLVEKYPDMIDMVDNCKETPLHYAQQGSNVSLVQYLIEKALIYGVKLLHNKTFLHV